MSREAILGKIQTALDVSARDTVRREAIEARLAAPPRHLVPARACKPAAQRIALFKSYLEAQGTTAIEVSGPDGVPAAIAGYLRDSNQPLCVRCGDDPVLRALPWASEPELARRLGRAEPTDTAGLSRAIAGVAETGTLVLASGAHNPVTLSFLPDTHLVVLHRAAIVGTYEEACELVARKPGSASMPRTINLISGPSRTGDIGGRIVMGMHGPRRLAVILVGNW